MVTADTQTSTPTPPHMLGPLLAQPYRDPKHMLMVYICALLYIRQCAHAHIHTYALRTGPMHLNAPAVRTHAQSSIDSHKRIQIHARVSENCRCAPAASSSSTGPVPAGFLFRLWQWFAACIFDRITSGSNAFEYERASASGASMENYSSPFLFGFCWEVGLHHMCIRVCFVNGQGRIRECTIMYINMSVADAWRIDCRARIRQTGPGLKITSATLLLASKNGHKEKGRVGVSN